MKTRQIFIGLGFLVLLPSLCLAMGRAPSPSNKREQATIKTTEAKQLLNQQGQEKDDLEIKKQQGDLEHNRVIAEEKEQQAQKKINDKQKFLNQQNVEQDDLEIKKQQGDLENNRVITEEKEQQAIKQRQSIKP